MTMTAPAGSVNKQLTGDEPRRMAAICRQSS
jgi:hypothetical protein